MAAVSAVDVEALETAFQERRDPARLGAREEGQPVHQVRAVAEQHRARAVELGGHGPHRPQLAAGHQAPGGGEQRPPATGVIDGEQDPVALAGVDHAVGVRQRGGDRLLAEHRPRSGLRGSHREVRVQVVTGDYADHVRPFPRQQLAEVVVGGGARAPVGPGPVELVDGFRAQVAHRRQLGTRMAHVRVNVRAGHDAPQPAGLRRGPPDTDSRQPDHGGSIAGCHSSDCSDIQ